LTFVDSKCTALTLQPARARQAAAAQPLGTRWPEYAAALDECVARVADFRPDCAVLSLGVDTLDEDPISGFRLQPGDFVEVGRKVAAMRLPTAIVLEGGYAIERIGAAVAGVLRGIAAD